MSIGILNYGHFYFLPNMHALLAKGFEVLANFLCIFHFLVFVGFVGRTAGSLGPVFWLFKNTRAGFKRLAKLSRCCWTPRRFKGRTQTSRCCWIPRHLSPALVFCWKIESKYAFFVSNSGLSCPLPKISIKPSTSISGNFWTKLWSGKKYQHLAFYHYADHCWYPNTGDMSRFMHAHEIGTAL